MFCKNCGTQIPDDSNACSNCGTVFSVAAAAPVVVDGADFAKNKGIVAFYSVVTPYFWLYYIACKESEYGKFFANNAMVLMLFQIVMSICAPLFAIPIIGWLAGMAAGIFSLVCWISNFSNALKGNMKPLPLFLGKFKIIN